MSYLLPRACLGAFCVTLSALVFLSSLSAREQTDLLSLVRAGHRAARESIHTLSATITIELTFPKEEVFMTGKYWRSPNLVRVQEVHSGINDYLLAGSEIRQVGRGRRPEGSGYSYNALRKPATDFFCACNAWSQMLIEFRGPRGGQHEFDRFLEFAKDPPKLKKETLDGRECIRLTMSYDMEMGEEAQITLWHDIGYNYLVRKLAAKYTKTGGSGEMELSDFLESPPGVFLPTKCRKQTSLHGKQVSGSVTTLSDVRINEPIPPGVFQLPSIPRGTIMSDWVQGTKYPVDENWRSIGRAEPIAKVPLIDPAALDESGDRSRVPRSPLHTTDGSFSRR
jgi:hypothetical protein